jgi:small subunit ribosomal protein S6
MRTYDVMLILSPDLGEEGSLQAIEELRKVIRAAGITPEQDESWGKRRLAYQIGRYREGIYHCFRLVCGGELVKELERRMKLSENIIRHISVRIDEDMKRQAKTDRKKKPRTGPPAPGGIAPEPAEPIPAEPGAAE